MRMRGLKKLWLMGCFLIVSLVANLFISLCVYALPSTAISCNSGEIIWNNNESQFVITLNCPGLSSFSETNLGKTVLTEADIDIQRIKLSTYLHNTTDITSTTPWMAEIIDEKIQLTFYSSSIYFNQGLTFRQISIEANMLFNELGVGNLEVNIGSDLLIDFSPSFAQDDNYDIFGVTLEIPANEGLLINDVESEGAISQIVIVDDTIYGDLIIGGDGSFSYTPNNDYYGDDSFRYYLIDASANISNIATVTISDLDPEVIIDYYGNSNSGSLPGYAKLGENVRLSFFTNEPVDVLGIKIGAKYADTVEKISDTNYVAYYTFQDSDIEGIVNYVINVSDRAGNTINISTENGIIFDKTPPEIVLDDSLSFCPDDADVVCLEVNDIYNETTILYALDSVVGGEPITHEVQVSGSVDLSLPGNYHLVFMATDNAGNATIFNRYIRVVDSVNEEYKLIDSDLIKQNIQSNLSQIMTNNFEHFTDLYFKKSIDDIKIIRVTFKGPIDISNSDFAGFVELITSKLETVKIGSADLNMDNFNDLSSFVSGGISLKFYNLQKLGYSSISKLSDLIKNLKIYDSDNNTISTKDSIAEPINFASCGPVDHRCYALNYDVKRLLSYSISKDNVAPNISVNPISTTYLGERVYLSGNIDDINSQLVLFVGDNSIYLEKSAISNGRWSIQPDSSHFGVGDYVVRIFATDIIGNQSTASTILRIRNHSYVITSSKNNSEFELYSDNTEQKVAGKSSYTYINYSAVSSTYIKTTYVNIVDNNTNGQKFDYKLLIIFILLIIVCALLTMLILLIAFKKYIK